jgi:hypothetical protein
VPVNHAQRPLEFKVAAAGCLGAPLGRFRKNHRSGYPFCLDFTQELIEGWLRGSLNVLPRKSDDGIGQSLSKNFGGAEA